MIVTAPDGASIDAETCRAAACRSGNRDWDDRTRILRLGSDPVVVRLSTVNGPVTINER